MVVVVVVVSWVLVLVLVVVVVVVEVVVEVEVGAVVGAEESAAWAESLAARRMPTNCGVCRARPICATPSAVLLFGAT